MPCFPGQPATQATTLSNVATAPNRCDLRLFIQTFWAILCIEARLHAIYLRTGVLVARPHAVYLRTGVLVATASPLCRYVRRLVAQKVVITISEGFTPTSWSLLALR